MQAGVVVTQAPAIFARGLAIAAQGSPEAHKSMAELQAMRAQQAGMQVPFIAQILKMTEIQEVEIAAMAAAAQGNEAITIMRHATALEEALPPPPGPPLSSSLLTNCSVRFSCARNVRKKPPSSLSPRSADTRIAPVRYSARALPLRAEMPKARRTSTRNSRISGRLTRSCRNCVRRRIT